MPAIVLSAPSRGFRTQRYGANPNPSYQPGGHTGDDWAFWNPATGQTFPDALAMDDGEVVWADWASKLGWPNFLYLNPDFNKADAIDESSGITVALKHWYGYTTYSHLEETPLNIGQKVKRGQRLGTVGNTGRSFGKHLHAELILFPVNFNTPTYGRTDPAKYMTAAIPTITTAGAAATAPATSKEPFTVAQYDEIMKKLNSIQESVKPINTASGPVTIRDFIAKGTRAAQAAEEQTAPINVSGGRQEGIRDFIAKGTRAAERSEARLAGLEAALKQALETPGADLSVLMQAAEQGAAKALSNLRIVNGEAE